jgi:hypothetical protein
MFQQLPVAFTKTLSAPKEGLLFVLNWRLDRGSLWSAAVVVVIFSILLNGVLVALNPALLEGPQLIPTSPFLQALIVWGGLVLTVYGCHFIGKMFGGEGAFDDSLHAMIWLQAVMVVFQAAQIVLLTLSDAFGGIASIGIFIYTIWLFVNFVAVVHGFKSLWMVFVGFIGASIGVGFGLVIIYTIIALVMGLEIQNV